MASNMTDDDKALVERLREEADEWDEPKSHDEFDMRGMLHSAADRIEADRAAVEAATIAKVVAWLRSLQNNGTANQAFAVAIRHACAAAINAGEWKQ